MGKAEHEALKEFFMRTLVMIGASLVMIVVTSLFSSLVIVPQRLQAVEKQTNQNTEDIIKLQEDTNVKITKIYDILVSRK